MEEIKPNVKIRSITIGILAFVLGVFVYVYFNGVDVVKDDLNDSSVASQNGENTINAEIGESSGIVVEAVMDSSEQVISKAPIPDLSRPLVYKMEVSEEIKRDIEINFKENIAILKKDPTRFDNWIDLGLIYSDAGDYEGARLAWEYASTLRPTNSLTYSNLGFLYGYQIKDNKKAEENYLIAIKNEPDLDYLYFRAFEFYRDVLNDKVKARNIIEQGAKAVPDRAQDLRVLLESL